MLEFFAGFQRNMHQYFHRHFHGLFHRRFHELFHKRDHNFSRPHLHKRRHKDRGKHFASDLSRLQAGLKAQNNRQQPAVCEDNASLCPLCDKHCPLTSPSCGKGAAYLQSGDSIFTDRRFAKR
jgi:hypothetical protein